MDTEILNTLQQITSSNSKLNDEYVALRDVVYKELGISKDIREDSIIGKLEQKVNKNTKDIAELNTKINSQNNKRSSDIKIGVDDEKNQRFSDFNKEVNRLKNQFEQFQKSLNDSNKKNINKEKSKNIAKTEIKKTNKERKIVEEAKPMIIQSFGEEAVETLNNLFQKIFKIEIKQPKNEIKKSSMTWLLALGAIVGVIIANFEKIKNWIAEFDWSKVWDGIKNGIITAITKIIPLIGEMVFNTFISIIDTFTNIIKSESFQNVISNIWDKINPLNLISPITTYLTSLFADTIPNAFRSTIDGIKDFIKQTFSWINGLFGFKFFGNDREPEPETIDPDNETYKQNEQQSENTKLNDIPESNNENQSADKESLTSTNKNIIISNELTNMNEVTGGKVNKSLVIQEGDKKTTMIPLDQNDNAVILKENGIIDKKLNSLINVITDKSKSFNDNFIKINNSIIQQTQLIDKLSTTKQTELIQSIDERFVSYDKVIANRMQIAISNNKEPTINRSNISEKQRQCLNNV